jgi:hypothetical protein
MTNQRFWLLLGACIAISITVGVASGIYQASWVVGIITWITVECLLIGLLMTTAIRMEDNAE